MTLAPSVPTLSEKQRVVLRMLAEALIPRGAGSPSAGEADVQGKWIDRVLRARPDLAPAVMEVIDQYADVDSSAELSPCRSEHPTTFDDLTLAVSAAYFMNPRVRKAFGYPGNAPKRKPAYPDESDFYLDDGALLEPVISRGRIYRPTPDSGSNE